MNELRRDNMPKLTATPDRASKPQPTVNLSEDDLSEIKNWKVGGKYSIVLEVELIRLSKGDVFMPESNRKMEATFKVLNAGTGKGEQKEDMNEKYPQNKAKIDLMKKKLKEG